MWLPLKNKYTFAPVYGYIAFFPPFEITGETYKICTNAGQCLCVYNDIMMMMMMMIGRLYIQFVRILINSNEVFFFLFLFLVQAGNVQYIYIYAYLLVFQSSRHYCNNNTRCMHLFVCRIDFDCAHIIYYTVLLIRRPAIILLLNPPE